MIEKPTYEELEKRIQELEQAESDYKRAEVMLWKSEEFLRTVINAITSPFAVINADDYTVEMANAAYSRGKASGQKCHAVSHCRDTPCAGVDNLCPIREVRQTKKPFIIEHIHYDEQGQSFNIENYAYPVLDRNGRVARIIKYGIDITKRKQAEESLTKEKVLLKAIIDNIPVFITRYDPNTKILYLNKEFETKIGWKTEEVQDIDLVEKVYPDPIYRQKAREYMQKATIEWQEFAVQSKSGEIIASEWSNIRLMDGTQVGIGIDITKRKQTEVEIAQRTSELEDMNAALKVLLKKRETDKDEIEERIFANYRLLLSPIINNLKKTLTLKNQEDMVNLLESELKNIISPFSKKLSDQMINLTPTEIHVANLIKLGKSNKEISADLNCSVHTISRHRENIRKKTGLKHKKTNLRSFLLTLH
ncbi:MAG: PAS domain S-box protein [Pseudomonadota bacterium]